jgi:hypothetical protein
MKWIPFYGFVLMYRKGELDYPQIFYHYMLLLFAWVVTVWALLP